MDLKNSGKFYFEMVATDWNASADAVGVLTAAGTFTNMVTNGTNGAFVYRTGAIWSNGANTTKTVGAIADTDRIGVAVDLDNDKVWFRKNNGNWNGEVIGSQNPASNVGGASISSYSATTLSPATGFGGNVAGGVTTANFGNSAFVDTPPSGFTSGWTSSPANPAAATGGASISSFSGTTLAPAAGFGGSGTQSGDNVTMNAGATAFAGTPPSGFTGWTV